MQSLYRKENSIGRTAYDIEIEQTCIRSKGSAEKYGDWYEEYDNFFRAVRKSKSDYPDVYGPDIPVGSVAHLVWIEWSAGDSFGSSVRGRVEAIGLFDNPASAAKLAEKIDILRENNSRYATKPTRSLEPGDLIGKYNETLVFEGLKIYTQDFLGYFESIDAIHIEATIVQAAKIGV